MIQKALFKVNEFCAANSIEYVVTGTTALSLHGIPSSFPPQDIDIKVFHLKPEQEKKLTELQFLSGLKTEEYKDNKCFSFIVNSCKVNVIVDNTDDYEEIFAQYSSISLTDEKHAKRHLINVQLVKYALADKMRLRREKDKAYMLDMIHHLTSLC